MLLVRCSRAASIGRGRSRMMCSPALADAFYKDIEKAKLMLGGVKEIYPFEQFKSDLAAGTVDADKLSAELVHHPEVLKIMNKRIMEMNLSSKVAAPEPPDFDAWKEKISTPGAVDLIKAMYEEEVNNPDNEKILQEKIKEVDEKIHEAFHGPDGLHAQAAKEVKAADASILQTIEELEAMAKQTKSIRTQTIAEILENEPQLRKEIEEELDNHNWGA
ncbi:hypothetical protein AB1Y20_010103 [Prymnesium parvum]|uniref:ATP synthase subunit d, mitochondrial n=2 Tax=Prymnesium parvum TaxID=97485 RepID=A0AB34K7X9_PRYPA